jgi:hypothetical protein
MAVPQGVASWFVEGTFAISIVPSFCWADKVFVQRRGKIAVKQTLAEYFSFYLIAQSVGETSHVPGVRPHAPGNHSYTARGLARTGRSVQ